MAGADDASADDGIDLKWEFDEERGRYYVSFPHDQLWSPVGMIMDLAFGVVFFYFGSIVGPMCVLRLMYDLFMYCVKWRL